MPQTMHELDPHGDTLLILTKANAPFAVWDEEEAIPHSPRPKPTRRAGAAEFFNFWYWDSNSWNRDNTMTVKTEETVREKPPGRTFAGRLPARKARKRCRSPSASPTQDDTEEEEIHMKLSSNHLVAASPYFKFLLRGQWKEGQTSSEFPHYTIRTAHWDEEALLLLMRIVHGKTRDVPVALDIEMLAKMATLVDYYHCHEALWLASKMWISRLELPKKYGRDLVLMLAVALVFSHEEIFQRMGALAFRELRGPLPTLDLPIPEHMARILDQKREDRIRKILASLHNLLAYLRDGRTVCSYRCATMLLGSLTIQMNLAGILHPRPVAPFRGLSLSSLLNTVEQFGRVRMNWCCKPNKLLDPIRSQNGWDMDRKDLEAALRLGDGEVLVVGQRKVE
ncbi:hypothetical protein VTK73DRAFT_7218 [Phialemonium thermophilum]|uniref:BTB domain-containing protein n=1 Tax=Phialemonium thermophilum TaxID=223376 RepID=A0ABR3WFN4_9PEZI